MAHREKATGRPRTTPRMQPAVPAHERGSVTSSNPPLRYAVKRLDPRFPARFVQYVRMYSTWQARVRAQRCMDYGVQSPRDTRNHRLVLFYVDTKYV